MRAEPADAQRANLENEAAVPDRRGRRVLLVVINAQRVRAGRQRCCAKFVTQPVVSCANSMLRSGPGSAPGLH